MLAVFRALTPKIFGIGLLPCELLLTLLHTQLLVFLAGWSLSLSIRATIGPRINKQSIWLEQHTPQEMKANEIADENLPQELWMGHLFHKTMPRTYESQSKLQLLDFKGPCTEALGLSPPFDQRNSLKSKTDCSMETPTSGRGKLPDLRS